MNKPVYCYYYYAMHMVTGEVKFFTYGKSRTRHPATSVKLHRLKLLKRKLLAEGSPWRIIETGYALEQHIKSLKPHLPQIPRYDASSIVYLSVLHDR